MENHIISTVEIPLDHFTKFHLNSIERGTRLIQDIDEHRNGKSRRRKRNSDIVHSADFISKNDDDPSVAVRCSLNSGRASGCVLRRARASGAGVPSRRVNAYARIRTHACHAAARPDGREACACSLAAANVSHPHDADPLRRRNRLSGHCGALRVVHVEISRARCCNNFKSRPSHYALACAYARVCQHSRRTRASDTPI